MFNNIPQVTKNLLILNVLMFLGTLMLQYKGIDLHHMLGSYPFGTVFFQPYQSVTHMFMHANLAHIFLNMFALVTFGSLLEKRWGSKRYFFFYIACGLFSYLSTQIVDYIHIQQLIPQLKSQGFDLSEIDRLSRIGMEYTINYQPYIDYKNLITTPSMGASGAIYGLLFAFAMLFPNSSLYVMFVPVPVKAKILVPVIVLIEIALSFYKVEGDNINHIAHLGGGIMGAIIVLYWRKYGKNFY